MPKTTGGTTGLYPVKIGPGDTRLVNAKFGPQGQVKILPPKRQPVVVAKPTVNTTIPNPRILEKVASAPRTFVLKPAQPGDPEPYVYGYKAVRPKVIAGDDSGDYLVLDLLWSAGEISQIEGPYLYIPDVGTVDIVPGSPLLYENFLGTSGQTASVILSALKGSYDTLAGKAHSVVSMQSGWNLNIMGFIKGRLIFDPRVSPMVRAYSDNPALILADILLLCGYTLDWSSVSGAADYCDELIGSPGTKRWTMGAVIDSRQSLRDWVHTLAQYCQCYVDIQGGYAVLVPDTPRASTHTVTADDMLEGSVRVRRRGSRDAPEAVTVTFRSSIDKVFSTTYGTENGAGTVSQLNMPFWNDFNRAKRKAEEVYRKAQNEVELEFTGFDDGLLHTLGDRGTITNAAVGISARDMVLVENEPVDRGRWRRRYIDYAASNYSDVIHTGTSNSTTLNGPYNPPNGPQPTVVEEWDDNSPRARRFKITFTGLRWVYLKDYYVKVVTWEDEETILFAADVTNLGAVTHTVYTDFTLTNGQGYTIYVYCRSIVDALSTTPGYADPQAFWTTAKWLGGLTNYYEVGVSDATSPKVWTGGLIPAAGSGDTYTDMTLVFAIHPNEYRENGMIFGAGGGRFTVAMYTAEGGIWLSTRDGTNVVKNAFIAAGSPTDYLGLTTGSWHGVMIALDGNSATSPQGRTLKVWVDGEEKYSGDFGTTGAENQPMDYIGPCWVGRGEMVSGSPALRQGLDCYLSFVWADETYLNPTTFWQAFFNTNANNGPLHTPLYQGASGEDRLGVPPDTFVPDGDFTVNLGSGPDWTEIGTVVDAPHSPWD